MNGQRGRAWPVPIMVVVLILAASYLTACLSSTSSRATPTPTKTPRGIDVALLPTNTPMLAPTSTSVPSPTPPPTIEVTATVTPTVTPWPTFGPDICPLTGKPVSDLALLDRRPLAIKIQNAERSRPQAGLPQADIVFEHLSEAAITRFTGVYLCQDVKKVGSVRSARFIDLEIPAMYKSLFAFSGTSPGLYPKFKSADFKDREFWYDQGIHSEAFFRDRELRAQGIPIEHTLFAMPDKVWEIAAKLGINQAQDLTGMTFSYEPPEGGEPGTTVHIPFPSRTMVVDYDYDPESGTYLRSQGGKPFMDAISGEQISVTNVVVAYAPHVDADFYEDYPRTNWPSVQIQLWGTGPAVLFRDGKAYEGLWSRRERDDMLVFRDKSGQEPIALKPGNTWVELVPLPGHRWSFEATWE